MKYLKWKDFCKIHEYADFGLDISQKSCEKDFRDDDQGETPITPLDIDMLLTA